VIETLVGSLRATRIDIENKAARYPSQSLRSDLLELPLHMQRHTATSGRETALLERRPGTRGGSSPAAPSSLAAPAASATLPGMLVAVSPQRAWSKQLTRAVAAESDSRRSPATASRDGKRDAPANIAAATALEPRGAPRLQSSESSVDRILKSSVKQHTYAYAPLRPPPSLESARSPYDPPRGISDPVEIRRDVKDSVSSQECATTAQHAKLIHCNKRLRSGRYPKLRAVDTFSPPPAYVYASAPVSDTIRSQPWALALQQQSNAALADAVREQFREVDELLQTQAARYNSDLLGVIGSIQRSMTKNEKHTLAKEALSPLCRQ
jgi:hypothetical protein